MARAAWVMRRSPSSASPGSAMCSGRGVRGVAPPGDDCTAVLVAVVVRLVRALDRHADVLRLLLGELGQLDPERVQVQPGDLLVQVLGQNVDTDRVLVG